METPHVKEMYTGREKRQGSSYLHHPSDSNNAYVEYRRMYRAMNEEAEPDDQPTTAMDTSSETPGVSGSTNTRANADRHDAKRA